MKEGKKQLQEVFAMWKKESKGGSFYFTGKHEGHYLVGFYNGKKKNPQEPDIRIYRKDGDGKLEGKEIVSLWMNVSKSNKKYLTGMIDGKKVVGFLSDGKHEKAPSFTVYYSDDTKETLEKENFIVVPDGIDEELPFN